MRRLFVVSLILLLVGCSSPQESGDLAPDFEVTRVDGNQFKLSQLKGNYVLLYFWGSWCGPCRQEAPSLSILYSTLNELTYHDADGFEVVTIAVEKNGDQAHAVASDFGFNWPNQIVEESPFVRMSPLSSLYGVSEIPSKFLIDPDGRIVMSNPSFEAVSKYLNEKGK